MGVKTRKLGNIDTQIIQWQAVFTGDGSTGLTAVAGRGYFIDTTSGTVEVTLPSTVSSNVGDKIAIKDFARTFGTNAVSIASNLFDGVHNTPSFSTNGQSVSFVYSGSTKGWMLMNEDTTTGLGAEYIAATGGTVTTSGNFKIHTFTGDGCFVVSQVGNAGGSNTVDYLVVAGGGGSAGGAPGSIGTGGGGAGGFRYSADTFPVACVPAEPLKAPAGLPVCAQTYPVTVGGGGSGSPDGASNVKGSSGSNSVFSTITSAGGGGGAADNNQAGVNGGSGGGGSNGGTAGSGNTPPVSPAQGTDGGSGSPTTSPYWGAAGGGGATTAGQPAQGGVGGNGGDGGGLPNAFGCNGVPCSGFRFYAGGGGGGSRNSTPNISSGGKGGGGAGKVSPQNPTTGNAGTANTGGGGGAVAGAPGAANGAAGGKGIVVIRYKFQG